MSEVNSQVAGKSNGENESLETPKFDLSSLLGSSILLRKGQLGAPIDLKGKYVALYFSGHWCPPCRQFTPSLVKTYQAAQKLGHPLEIVFVSSDRNVEAFSEYYDEMPWAAIPFGEYNVRRNLMETFKVNGIPALIVLGPDGQVINSNARGDVATDPEAFKFPWKGNTDLNPNQVGALTGSRIFLLLLIAWAVWRIFF